MVGLQVLELGPALGELLGWIVGGIVGGWLDFKRHVLGRETRREKHERIALRRRQIQQERRHGDVELVPTHVTRRRSRP
ncbi:MAG: hypothetical protein AAF533_01315 [Acidobacteriota bacterium]